MWSFLKQRDAATGFWKFFTFGGRFARSDCAARCCNQATFILAANCCDPRIVIVYPTTQTCEDGSPVWRQGGGARLLHFSPPAYTEGCYLTDPTRIYTLVELIARFGGQANIPYGAIAPSGRIPCSVEGSTCNSDLGCPECDCCLTVDIFRCDDTGVPTLCCDLGSDFTIHATRRTIETLSFREYARYTLVSTGFDPCTGAPVDACYSPLSGWMIGGFNRFTSEVAFHYFCENGVWNVECLQFDVSSVVTSYERGSIVVGPNQCPPPPGYIQPVINVNEFRCETSGCPSDQNTVPTCANYAPLTPDYQGVSIAGGPGCSGTITENFGPAGPYCPNQPVPGASQRITTWNRSRSCLGGNIDERVSQTGDGLERRTLNHSVRWTVDVNKACGRLKCPPDSGPPFPHTPLIQILNRGALPVNFGTPHTAGSFL